MTGPRCELADCPVCAAGLELIERDDAEQLRSENVRPVLSEIVAIGTEPPDEPAGHDT